MQLLAKFKKILYMEFRATLNFRNFRRGSSGVNLLTQLKILFFKECLWADRMCFLPWPLLGLCERVCRVTDSESCTMAVLDMFPKKYWRRILLSKALKSKGLAVRGDAVQKGVGTSPRHPWRSMVFCSVFLGALIHTFQHAVLPVCGTGYSISFLVRGSFQSWQSCLFSHNAQPVGRPR